MRAIYHTCTAGGRGWGVYRFTVGVELDFNISSLRGFNQNPGVGYAPCRMHCSTFPQHQCNVHFAQGRGV